MQETWFDPWWGRTPGDGNGYLPGEANGQRSLAGYSLWGHKESDTTEHLWSGLRAQGQGHRKTSNRKRGDASVRCITEQMPTRLLGTTLLDILWAAGELLPRDAPSSLLWVCSRPAQGRWTSAGILKGFPDPIPNSVWGLPIPTSSPQMPAGHLKNQLNCSAIYSERDQILQVKGSAPQDLPLLLTPTRTQVVTCTSNQPATNLRFWWPTPTQVAEHKPGLPPVLDQLATNQRFPQPPYWAPLI